MSAINSDWKSILFSKSTLIRLIIANVVVFLLYHIPLVFIQLSGQFNLQVAYESFFLNNFAVPANLTTLITHPWTLITNMFFHIEVGHILMNMVWLYWFGQILEDLNGKRSVLPIFIWGGLIGACTFILAYNVVPQLHNQVGLSKALGASAGVMAIVAATATLAPNYEMRLLFLGRVKLIWLAVGIVVLDFIAIPSGNAGGHIAHLGGVFIGWFYIYAYKRGTNLGAWINTAVDYLTTLVQPKPKYTKGSYRKMPDPYDRKESPTTASIAREQQKKTDIILDKIAKSGYDSLTKEEKEFLFSISNKK